MGTLELSYCFITHTSTLAHFMQSSSLLPSLSRHRPLSRIHDSHVLDPSLSFRSPFLPLVNLAAPAFPPFESSSTFIASGDPTVICLTSAPVESSLSGALGDDLIYYTAPAIIRISLPPIPYSDVHSPSRPLLPIILPRLPLIVYPSSQELLLGWNQGQAITGDHSTPAVPPPPSSSYYNRHIPHGPPPYTTSTNPTLPPNLMHSNTMSQYWMPPMSPPPQPSMDPTALRNDPHDLHPPPYDPSPSLYYPPYTKMELQDPRMAIVRVSPVPLLRLVDIATQRPAASFPTLRYHPTPEPPTFNDSPKYQMSVGSTSRPAHSVPPGPTVTRSSSHGFSPPVSPSAWHTRRPRRVARSSIRRSASCSIDFTDENALDQHRQSHLNQSSTVTDGTPHASGGRASKSVPYQQFSQAHVSSSRRRLHDERDDDAQDSHPPRKRRRLNGSADVTSIKGSSVAEMEVDRPPRRYIAPNAGWPGLRSWRADDAIYRPFKTPDKKQHDGPGPAGGDGT